MSVFTKEAFQMSAMPTPAASRPGSPGFEENENPHIVEIDVESVLFDMDGTLINSSPAVVVAWKLFAETYPLDLDDILRSAHGMRTIDVLRKWCKISDPELLKTEVLRFETAILNAAQSAASSGGQGIETLPGVAKLLDDLSSEKALRGGEEKWAVCTSSTFFYASKALPIANLTTPKVFVTAESVTNGKPAPDPYLMGAQGCHASPFMSLVVEDAPTGIKAGKAAGSMVLATCTSHTAEELEKEKPDFLVENLSHVTAKWNNDTGTFRIVIDQPVGRKTPAATPDATPVATPAHSRSGSFSSVSGRSRYQNRSNDEASGADSVFGSPQESRAGSPEPEEPSSGLQRKSSVKQGVPGGVTLEGFKKALGANAQKQRQPAPESSADDAPSSQFDKMNMQSNVATPDITRPASPVQSALPRSVLPSGKHRVAVVGSGSFGTALAKIAAKNVASRPNEFHSEVRMWVREKIVNGKQLTKVINATHKNERYLPDVRLPSNLVAVGNLKQVVKDATMLIMVTPHQFLATVLNDFQAEGVITPGAIAISAIKGVDVNGSDISTFASKIEEMLGTPCAALGGPNVAQDVANEQFCETTVGAKTDEECELWSAVFNTKKFKVSTVTDVAGVSLAGALKNVVALAAGFVDGLKLGSNTKASIMRMGLAEMAKFTVEFFPGSSKDTFSEPAGMADLITSCYSGRNKKCAEIFAKTGDSWEKIEKEQLKGQLLQGTLTSKEVHNFLVSRKRTYAYPLFEMVYQISFEGTPVKNIIEI